MLSGSPFLLSVPHPGHLLPDSPVPFQTHPKLSRYPPTLTFPPSINLASLSYSSACPITLDLQNTRPGNKPNFLGRAKPGLDTPWEEMRSSGCEKGGASVQPLFTGQSLLTLHQQHLPHKGQ